jgi:hypothetical protein
MIVILIFVGWNCIWMVIFPPILQFFFDSSVVSMIIIVDGVVLIIDIVIIIYHVIINFLTGSQGTYYIVKCWGFFLLRIPLLTPVWNVTGSSDTNLSRVPVSATSNYCRRCLNDDGLFGQRYQQL